jgi:phosphomevalonate kinase
VKGDAATVVRAPGKLFLLGEYAVVAGGPALVMAVDRYVCLREQPGSAWGDDLVAFTVRAAAHELGLETPRVACTVDSSEFYQDGCKLGLGSSAAVVAACLGKLYSQAGNDVESSTVRQEMWRVGKAIHDRFQQTAGSGADLAASLLGGYTVVRPRLPALPLFERWRLPPDIELAYVWTGSAASTPHLLQGVRAFAQSHAREYKTMMSDMTAAARQVLARTSMSGHELMSAFRQYGALMQRLGDAAGVPIVTPAISALMALAATHGGAGKPSGAGGGDFVVAAFDSPAAAADFCAACTARGFAPLAFRCADRGVHCCAPDNTEKRGLAT